jgi:hypothetical protein
MQKSDAMVQYEKGIEPILKSIPKGAKEEVMHIEVANFVMAAAAIFIVLIAATTMMFK